MPDPVADVPVDDCVAAYRTLELDTRASAGAIRQRYRELATRYHPDKWPHASKEQVNASRRMAEINAAYQLIRDAPLEDHAPLIEELPETTLDEERDERIREVQAVDLWIERIARFVVGAVLGLLLGIGIYQRGVLGELSALVLLPLVFGAVFMMTPMGGWRVHDVLQLLLWK
jgi:DnaJ-like protein